MTANAARAGAILGTCRQCRRRTQVVKSLCEGCSEPRYVDDPAAQAFVAKHDQGAKLEEIGEHLGITRERVRQIEVVALKRFLARLALAGIERADLALFISQRSHGHMLEYSRRPKSPTDAERDAIRHQQRKVCACGAAKKMRATACSTCLGVPPVKYRGTDAANLSRAIDALPPSDTSVRIGLMAQGVGYQAEAIAVKVERVGPVLDALREWLATEEIEQ